MQIKVSQALVVIKLIITYLIITFLLYFITPIQYTHYNTELLIALNVFYLMSLYTGFKYGLKNNTRLVIDKINFNITQNKFTLLLLISLVYILYRLPQIIGIDSFNIEAIINKILFALTDLGKAYVEKFDFAIEQQSKFALIIELLISPIFFLVKVTGLYFYRYLNKRNKILLISAIFIDIFTYVCIGTNKRLFDYLIFFIMFIMMKKKETDIDTQKTRSSKTVLVTISIVICVLYFFSQTFSSRMGHIASIEEYANRKDDVNYNSWIFKVLPGQVGLSYVGLNSYLAQGYQAMDMALSMEHVPCHGLGHSRWMSRMFGGDEAIEKMYQYRMEPVYGWSFGQSWHSVYVCFANDVTFWGVPIVLLILAFWFARAWKKSLIVNSPTSIALSAIFFIMFFYLNANNQIFDFLSATVEFWGIVLLCAFTSIRYTFVTDNIRQYK